MLMVQQGNKRVVDLTEEAKKQERLTQTWARYGSIKKLGICIVCGRFTHHRVAQEEPTHCVHCGQEGVLSWIQLTKCKKCLQQ